MGSWGGLGPHSSNTSWASRKLQTLRSRGPGPGRGVGGPPFPHCTGEPGLQQGYLPPPDSDLGWPAPGTPVPPGQPPEAATLPTPSSPHPASCGPSDLGPSRWSVGEGAASDVKSLQQQHLEMPLSAIEPIRGVQAPDKSPGVIWRADTEDRCRMHTLHTTPASRPHLPLLRPLWRLWSRARSCPEVRPPG